METAISEKVICNSLSSSSTALLQKLYPEKMGSTQVRYWSSSPKNRKCGSSAVVYPGFHFGLNVEVAVKHIQEKHLKLNQTGLSGELQLLQNIDHINIIRLVESYYSPIKGTFVVLEKARTTFHKLIVSGRVTRDKILALLKGAGDGLEYLHKLNIIHGNIKPSNILIVTTKNNIDIAKLSDFELSKQVSTSSLNYGTLSSCKRKFSYKRPEKLEWKEDQFVNDMAQDIFAFGVTLYFGLSKGKFSLETETISTKKPKITNINDMPDKLSNHEFSAKDLLKRIIAKKPSDRPKIGEILSHCLFWDLGKVKEFLFNVVRTLNVPEKNRHFSRVQYIKNHVDTCYKQHYRNLMGKTFNWHQQLDKEKRELLLTSITFPSTERKYGDGESVFMLIKLYRDKLVHVTDMKTNSEGNNYFTENGIFNEKIYITFFLNLAPNVVDVIYCVLRGWRSDVSLNLLKAEYYSGCIRTSSLFTPKAVERSLSNETVMSRIVLKARRSKKDLSHTSMCISADLRRTPVLAEEKSWISYLTTKLKFVSTPNVMKAYATLCVDSITASRITLTIIIANYLILGELNQERIVPKILHNVLKKLLIENRNRKVWKTSLDIYTFTLDHSANDNTVAHHVAILLHVLFALIFLVTILQKFFSLHLLTFENMDKTLKIPDKLEEKISIGLFMISVLPMYTVLLSILAIVI